MNQTEFREGLANWTASRRGETMTTCPKHPEAKLLVANENGSRQWFWFCPLCFDTVPDASGVGKVLRAKYGNKPTIYNGIRYQSKREADTAASLDLQKRAGEVLWWCRQARFVLPGGIEYVCDFIVCYSDGRVEVVDPKGCRTEVFRLKNKLMMSAWGIKVREV